MFLWTAITKPFPDQSEVSALPEAGKKIPCFLRTLIWKEMDFICYMCKIFKERMHIPVADQHSTHFGIASPCRSRFLHFRAVISKFDQIIVQLSLVLDAWIRLCSFNWSSWPTCIDMLDELLQLSTVMFSVIGGMSSMSPGPKWDSSASWPSPSRAWFTLA